MNYIKSVYLSLGSNTGNKEENLKKAVEILQAQGGKLTAFSKVYKTPSWGFDSGDFLNACIALDTELQPQELLEVILTTERNLGRVRSQKAGYTDRTIDIDILFYGTAVIDEPELKVPHPHLHLRKFVLKPLTDIAPDFIHPVFNKKISELLVECEDESELTETGLSLRPHEKANFSKFNFIAIEGNIGAGKTSLAKKIAEDFNGKLILERFADNPFLPKFYADMQRYAFPLEMSFLADRYQQFMDDTSQLDLFKDFMVSDYDIFKSLVFAKVTLTEEEFRLYRKLFNFMYKDVIKPDVYVYLHQNTETLLQNIKTRNRDYEQNIQPGYLDAINLGYREFMKSHMQLNSLVIDISGMDFLKNKTDYFYIIDKIHDFYDKIHS